MSSSNFGECCLQLSNVEITAFEMKLDTEAHPPKNVFMLNNSKEC